MRLQNWRSAIFTPELHTTAARPHSERRRQAGSAVPV
eukprot:CAMPEP_0184550632 /NCGR_PEP_ID=MMETSP0199_2-20130426/21184_1 /TAXON_ID=1112570 /ORGANISM="Thraustochytrium sp., Strain LLF1b" /LENGTH=36 /DNA_ID= /DNA_START= /DNA_END= /DNA_ORIENTATION=